MQPVRLRQGAGLTTPRRRALRDRARTLRSDAEWAWIWLRDPARRGLAGYVLLTRLAAALAPGYVLTDPEKTWFRDAEFLAAVRSFDPDDRAADRRFLLRELLRQVEHVPGDTAECGVFDGTSSWFICEHFKGSGRIHHGFDTFEGLTVPGAVDGGHWREGDLRASEAAARRRLEPYGARLYRGRIPERFSEVADRTYAFVHVDVDLYEPTRDSIAFFYPRLAPGGILVCDDYGFTTCPGATRAIDEFLADKPELVLHAPTGQGIVIRAAS